MTNSEARKRHATPPTPDALDAIRARLAEVEAHRDLLLKGFFASCPDAHEHGVWCGSAWVAMEARATAAESAREAAEGALRELRRELAEVRYELGDALTRLTVTEGALREVRKAQEDRREALALYAPGKNHALACHLDAIDDALALAPVTTDETEGGGVDE